MKTLIVSAVFLLATLHYIPAISAQCTNANEVFSDCGNLCEDSCANNCEPPINQPFALFNASNPDCVPGCYCSNGYIRDDYGDCVANVPYVCSNDRCGVISANSVYRRCVAGVESACFERTIAIKVSGYSGKCMCATGFSLNANRKCIKTNSRACRRQRFWRLNILFMQTTYDC